MSMAKKPHIESLSNEILQIILDQIEPDTDRTVPIDRRQFLSVESFQHPPPSPGDSLRDIGNFRRVNRRFSEVGAPLLFGRVAGRFSQRGLDKLEILADWPHLARHVKKFSYLVPYFYSDEDSFEGTSLRSQLQNANLYVDVEVLRAKAREQRELRESGRDVAVLKKAIASFSSLQLVQLLRVADQDDVKVLRFLRQFGNAEDAFHLTWAPACLHGSQTIGAALLAADVPWTRFSSPMLSAQSAEFLATNAPQQLPILAARLTCLALHFEDGQDFDMSNLSGLFRTVFENAKDMQAIHLGFPAHRPLNLPLESIFHNVTWDKLVAFGVQGWNLNADEILGLVLRHRDKLKGLRLRDVRLKQGSLWKTVLGTLRSSMQNLEWVSLRRIDYVQHFEESLVGIEVPDIPQALQFDSDSNEDDDDDQQQHENDDNDDGEQNDDYVMMDAEDDHDNDSDAGIIHGPEADELEFPSFDTTLRPVCTCNSTYPSTCADDLDDDGIMVSNAKRKLWEKWVIQGCPKHDT